MKFPLSTKLTYAEVPPWHMMIVKAVQMHKKLLMRSVSKDSNIGIEREEDRGRLEAGE